MVRTKLTAGRWTFSKQPRTMAVEADFFGKTLRPLKIKVTLPEQKTVDIKKNGQIVKRINVRRKAKYFSGRNR